MKLSFQAKELKIVILDSNDLAVVDYQAENYKAEIDMQGLINAIVALLVHAKTTAEKHAR